ncbi:hypothetical protein ANN_03327 [Periplaneta americana]|uniref:Uncharacterized protein n=1 Tax=Periplaneta americana TaxID=6978 RepID=A0ABQ8U2S4_PERAM|nr:hypothetical protein ANN_03327 [Periplaneta americana]
MAQAHSAELNGLKDMFEEELKRQVQALTNKLKKEEEEHVATIKSELLNKHVNDIKKLEDSFADHVVDEMGKTSTDTALQKMHNIYLSQCLGHVQGLCKVGSTFVNTRTKARPISKEIIMIDYLAKRRKITGEYPNLLQELKEKIREKKPDIAKKKVIRSRTLRLLSFPKTENSLDWEEEQQPVLMMADSRLKRVSKFKMDSFEEPKEITYAARDTVSVLLPKNPEDYMKIDLEHKIQTDVKYQYEEEYNKKLAEKVTEMEEKYSKELEIKIETERKIMTEQFDELANVLKNSAEKEQYPSLSMLACVQKAHIWSYIRLSEGRGGSHLVLNWGYMPGVQTFPIEIAEEAVGVTAAL